MTETIESKDRVCIKCNRPIYESVTGKIGTPTGFMDRECYAKVLGDTLDQHPSGGLGGLRPYIASEKK